MKNGNVVNMKAAAINRLIKSGYGPVIAKLHNEAVDRRLPFQPELQYVKYTGNSKDSYPIEKLMAY